MMQYFLTPHGYNYEPFVYWENAFNDNELNWIQQIAKSASSPALVGGMSDQGTIDNSIRRSELNWLQSTPDNLWVFEKLSFIVSTINSQHFQFDLTGFGEALQLTNYDERYKGTYGWHIDLNSSVRAPSRKLSLVLQLSDPSEYEGGNLEIQPFSGEVFKIKKQRGLVVLFPSWVLHQVTPITKGNRQSLVSWITGPKFK